MPLSSLPDMNLAHPKPSGISGRRQWGKVESVECNCPPSGMVWTGLLCRTADCYSSVHLTDPFKLSGPLLLYFKVMGFVQGLQKLAYVKYVEQCLPHKSICYFLRMPPSCLIHTFHTFPIMTKALWSQILFIVTLHTTKWESKKWSNTLMNEPQTWDSVSCVTFVIESWFQCGCPRGGRAELTKKGDLSLT